MEMAIRQKMAPFIVFAALLSIERGNAQLFNYTQAVSGWGSSSDYPSAQANNSIPIIQQNIDFPQRLGTIFYNSISQNQSYGVADALRWMLRPVGMPIYAAPSTNMTEYDSVSASLGTAIAYAMNYAYRARANLTIVAPPNASSTILRSSTDPLVQVTPNSTDIFFVAASALMGAVFHGCDADWHCHSMDCDLPEEVVEKRTGVCCPTVSPMLTAISRQLLLLNLEYLVDAALPASVQAAAPTTLEFLARCNRISSGGEPAQIGLSACNINASANYMGHTLLVDVNSNTPGAPPVGSAVECCLACIGNLQCNVWVYCGSSYGCPGCDNRTLNYQPGLGATGQTFGPYGPGCSAGVTGAPSFPTGTCSLKSAVFRVAPQAYAQSSAGFTSGYIMPHSLS